MKISALLAIPVILVLSACGAPVELGVASYVGMSETKRDDPPPADTADQIAPHESWCYESLGYPECYPYAQNVDPNRLINVDPATRYPLTPQAYRDIALEYHE